MLLETILGLATGLAVAYIADELLYRFKKRHESPIIRRMRTIIRDETTRSDQIENPRLNVDSLLTLVDSWVLPIRSLGKDQATLLRNIGLAELIGDVIIVNRNAMRRLVDGLRDRHFEPPHQIIDLPEEILMELGKRGILSVTFFEVSSEVGPRFLFATTKTKLTEKLYTDVELQNRIFLNLDLAEFAVEGSKVLMKGVGGGERGLEGFVVAEVVQNADVEAAKRVLSRICRVPRDQREAKEILEEILGG